MGRNSLIPEIEQRLGKPIRDLLFDRIKQGKKPDAIAADIGISKATVYCLIKSLDLKKAMDTKAAKFAGSNSELKLAIDDFIKSRQLMGCSPRTISDYQYSFQRFLWWMDKESRPLILGAYNVENIRDYILYVKNTEVRWDGSSASSKRKTTSATLLAYRRRLSAFATWLVLQERIPKNPMDKIEKIKMPKREPEDLSDGILLKILNSFDVSTFDGLRNKAIIMMFLDTGLRLDGMVNLRADQIDFDTNAFRVIEKGNKERQIRFSDDTKAILRTYLAARKPIAKTDKLWVRFDNGDHFNRSAISAMVKTLNKLSPKQHVHPHIFRHIFAARFMKNGGNPLQLMVLGGWSSLELVQHYASAYSAKDAWKIHEQASPVRNLLAGSN